MDLALTATALVGFAEVVSSAEDNFNERMETLVRRVHRPALLRVHAFRIPDVDRLRMEIIHRKLSKWLKMRNR